MHYDKFFHRRQMVQLVYCGLWIHKRKKNITVVLNGSGHKNLVPLPHKCDLNSQKGTTRGNCVVDLKVSYKVPQQLCG